MKMKLITKTLALSCIFIFTLMVNTKAQEDEELIMKQLKGTKIDHQTYKGYDTYKVYDPQKMKWGLYGVIDSEEGDNGMVYQIEVLISPVCDEIFWDEQLPVIFARLDKKYAFITAFNDGIKKVNPEFEFDDFRTKKKGENNFLLVKQNDLWALFDYRSSNVSPLLIYSSEVDVPLRFMEKEEVTQFQRAYAFTKADKIQFDPLKADGVFRARNKSTKKWGLYQLVKEKEILELIPAEYDSLEFIVPNEAFTIVYQHGKAGVYLSKLKYEDAKQTVLCEYDAWKKVKQSNGKIYLALAEEGLWGWMDWLSGDEKTDFNATSFESLPNPDYDQLYENQ